MTDRRMTASRPQYADYVARTSGFIPLPPKRAPNGVPQPQLRGKGPEEGLPGQPGKVPAARVVREQRDRHAERFLAAPAGLDPGHQVQPPGPVQLPPDPAVRVLQRVGGAAQGGRAGHRGQEQVPVRRLGPALPGHHPARRPVARRVVRQQLQLVPGVEGHQVPRRPRRGEQRPQPRRGEDPLAERLAQPGVVQPPLVLDGQQRERGQHPVGVQPAPVVAGRDTVLAVPRDGPDAAARRLGLEHVPVQPSAGQGQGRHRLRVVGGAAPVDQPPVRGQPDRLARRPQPDGYFRAVRHPVDVGAEFVGEEPVPFVPAVEPDLLAEQAARYAHPGPDLHRITLNGHRDRGFHP